MEIPNTMAWNFPLAFLSPSCMKKLTVMGIIGNTQGVRMAARPAMNAKMNSSQMDEYSSSSIFISSSTLLSSMITVVGLYSPSLFSTSAASAFTTAPLNANSNSTSSGGRHCLSSQHM